MKVRRGVQKMETKNLEAALEVIPFLELPEGIRILEVTHSSPLFTPVLGCVNLLDNKKIDLCVVNSGEMTSNVLGYYEKIFFHSLGGMHETHWNQAYDVVLIPDALNTLSKQEGDALLHWLIQRGVSLIYALVKDDNLDQTWTIPDFKSFDISFYRLPKLNQKLIKIYPATSKAVKPLQPMMKSRNPLTILYVITHRSLTGGLKILYEQMKFLQKLGYRIKLMIRGDYDRIVPTWVEDFVPDEEIIRRPYEPYLTDDLEADIIFATFTGEFEELVSDRIPVFYWEQGHEALYGDVQSLQSEVILRNRLKKQFSHDIYYATNSLYVHDIVQTRFGKNSYIFPIYIDTSFYYPEVKKEKEKLTILLVGNPVLKFKGFVKALTVLVNVWNRGLRFKVVWACQVKPEVSPVPFEIDYQVNVSQLELAKVYREADILLSCSDYEGAAMPPLEAMASGVCVVATNCGGIMQYAQHEKNALISQTHQVSELADGLTRLLTDPALRERLIQNGLKTAQSLSFERGITRLENILQTIVDDFQRNKQVNYSQYKVSVIIPAYQVEKYILRSVSSVLRQTFKDIEVIIVDDGSTDLTAKLSDDIAKAYQNIQVIHQSNLGSAKAREVGVQMAKGEYLLFLDADDWLDKEALEKLYTQATLEEADIVLFQAVLVIGNKGYELNIFSGCPEEIAATPVLHFLQDKIKPSMCAKFIKRSFLNEHQIHFPDISYAEDVVVTSRLLRYHPKLSFCDQRFYYYDQREGSLVHSVNETRLEIFKALEEVANVLRGCQLYDRYKKEYINFAFQHLSPVKKVCLENQELKAAFDSQYQHWYEKYLNGKFIIEQREGIDSD